MSGFWFESLCRLVRTLPRGKGAIPRVIAKFIQPHRMVSIKLLSGATLVGSCRALDELIYIRNNGGIADAHVVSLLLKLLRPSDVFFDVGGNLGVIATEVSARVKCEVHCFEPIHFLAQGIRETILRNRFSNTRVHEIGIAEFDGSANLFLEKHLSHSSLVPRTKSPEMISCSLLRIDTALMAIEASGSPSVIKLDIEGGELNALKGAVQTLQKGEVSVVFECDVNARRFGYSLREIITFFNSRTFVNYLFYKIESDGLVVLNTSDPLESVYGDFLALHPSHKWRIEGNMHVAV
jgi:FkbM family methyltransferase